VIANPEAFRSFRDGQSSSFDSRVVISYPVFGSNFSVFMIFYVVNKVRMLRFIFEDRVKFKLFIGVHIRLRWRFFLYNLKYAYLLLIGKKKDTEVLSISKFVKNELILFIKPVLYS